MKKFIFIFTVIHALLFLATNAIGQNVQAYISYATFYSPEYGPYVETYVMVEGNSLEFELNDNNKYQGVVELTMIFKKDTNIVNFKKIDLYSPEILDTTKKNITFNAQERFVLPNDTYILEIFLKDKNAEYPSVNVNSAIILDYPENNLAVSGMQFIDTYTPTKEHTALTKSGYELISYVSDFFPEKIEQLSFYAEIYNTDKAFGKDSLYVVNHYIENSYGEIENDLFVTKRKEGSNVQPILGSLNIKNLRSGNYYLVVEVRDKNNEIQAKNRRFFQRSNPGYDTKFSNDQLSYINVNNTFAKSLDNQDTLKESIACIYPIASDIERINIQSFVTQDNMNIEKAQKFFYHFWVLRNPQKPEEAWHNYYKEVRKVNANYSTGIHKGYETDRGRVYLEYGPPNSITKSTYSPATKPYEVWFYYQLKNQRNRKFVFYNQDFVTNEYELIHSNAIGEINNPQWQYQLYGRPANNVDMGEFDDNTWGERTLEIFNDPR